MRHLVLCFTFLACHLAQADAGILTSASFDFGGMDLETEYPTQGSRFDHFVRYMNGPAGKTRVEFLETRNGKESTTPFTKTAVYADIQMLPEGKVVFKFEQPLKYKYIMVNESTGKSQELSGEVSTLTANISQANTNGFRQILLGAPSTGYISKGDEELVKEMARIYRRESPVDIMDFSKKELVPGLVLRGRPGLAKFLDRHSSDLPRVMFPVNIPLEIVINPALNRIDSDKTRVNGGPSFRTIGAITKDTVGLDNNGSSGAGGPDAFAYVISHLTAVDLQDAMTHDFVAARAEILRMSRKIESEFERIHGLSRFITSGDRIIMVKGGKGDDENLDSFHSIVDCVSLLTGRAN